MAALEITKRQAILLSKAMRVHKTALINMRSKIDIGTVQRENLEREIEESADLIKMLDVIKDAPSDNVPEVQIKRPAAKKIRIDNSNIERFAEIMYAFNCYNQYDRECFSICDIERESIAIQTTDKLLTELDKAGFDIQNIKSFQIHAEWTIRHLTAPVTENPVFVFTNPLYEEYLDEYGYTEFYTENDVIPAILNFKKGV